MPKLEGLGMWLGCDSDAVVSVSHLFRGSEHEMIAISAVSYHEISRVVTRNHFTNIQPSNCKYSVEAFQPFVTTRRQSRRLGLVWKETNPASAVCNCNLAHTTIGLEATYDDSSVRSGHLILFGCAVLPVLHGE